MLKPLSLLICLVVSLVGFILSGIEAPIGIPIYIAIGCLGLIGLAIVLAIPGTPVPVSLPKPDAAPTETNQAPKQA